jgi:hypothetical protein
MKSAGARAINGQPLRKNLRFQSKPGKWGTFSTGFDPSTVYSGKAPKSPAKVKKSKDKVGPYDHKVVRLLIV